MRFYLRAAYFHLLRYFAYPLEILATVARRFVDIGFLVLFWVVVARESGGAVSAREMVSYILIAGSIASITSGGSLHFGGLIGDLVKSGEITNYLIRPISIIPYLYASFLGKRSVVIAVSLGSLAIGIAMTPVTLSVARIALFIAYFVISAIILMALSVLIGLVSFYVTEASSVRHTASHIIRVLSGALVPLSFFPQPWRDLALLSPFPVIAYAPASVFAPGTVTISASQMLGVGCFWSVALWVLALAGWSRALRKYDAIGI